jgi:high-affinity nickel-transport protein
MLGAYGWAFTNPMRRLYYNMTITFVSVVVALMVGGIEAFGLIGSKLGASGPFWSAIAALNQNFGAIGYLIIAVFIGSWILSALVYRIKGYHKLETA